jgi:hypothetical protein
MFVISYLYYKIGWLFVLRGDCKISCIFIIKRNRMLSYNLNFESSPNNCCISRDCRLTGYFIINMWKCYLLLELSCIRNITIHKPNKSMFLTYIIWLLNLNLSFPFPCYEVSDPQRAILHYTSLFSAGTRDIISVMTGFPFTQVTFYAVFTCIHPCCKWWVWKGRNVGGQPCPATASR